MIELTINFATKKDLEDVINNMSDMLCFLKGYKTCLELNEDYTNQLEYCFDNMEFLRELNIKMKELYNK